MLVASCILAGLAIVVVAYAALVAASNDDDRQMRDYRAARDAYERIFE